MKLHRCLCRQHRSTGCLASSPASHQYPFTASKEGLSAAPPLGLPDWVPRGVEGMVLTSASVTCEPPPVSFSRVCRVQSMNLQASMLVVCMSRSPDAVQIYFTCPLTLTCARTTPAGNVFHPSSGLMEDLRHEGATDTLRAVRASHLESSWRSDGGAASAAPGSPAAAGGTSCKVRWMHTYIEPDERVIPCMQIGWRHESIRCVACRVQVSASKKPLHFYVELAKVIAVVRDRARIPQGVSVS